jgi:hypothetical protein
MGGDLLAHTGDLLRSRVGFREPLTLQFRMAGWRQEAVGRTPEEGDSMTVNQIEWPAIAVGRVGRSRNSLVSSEAARQKSIDRRDSA